MNKVSLSLANELQDYIKISELADIIWHEHYSSLLSQQQIDYMLNKFLSPDAMRQAASQGTEYYIIMLDDTPIGYAAIILNQPCGKLFLSKLYILGKYRGRGYGKDTLEQLENLGSENKQSAVWLTVNKRNPTYEAYKKMGFKTVSEAVTDIGNGFVMDDYIMEKSI